LADSPTTPGTRGRCCWPGGAARWRCTGRSARRCGTRRTTRRRTPGWSSRRSSRSRWRGHRLRPASISKLFTSILAVQRIERGALELEATVASYLPEFAGGGKQDITVRQLLTHTSGFRAWIPLHQEPTREGKLRMLWDEVPASAPGSAYLYSDLNLISLQLILERITGRTLDVLSTTRSPLRSGCTARATTRPPPGSRKSRPPRTPGRRGPVWTAAWSGARCTTRTPTASTGWPATPGVLLRLGPGGPGPRPPQRRRLRPLPHPLRGLRRPPLHRLQHRVPGR
ncbi:serine hydrolase domain-containing protein, partial [Streptomyces griseus]|uniref:serine hydrolase domain-containing protein n=1 Tax=Streptomyces griseus TaxID=1911 RepID=UPI001CEFAA8A